MISKNAIRLINIIAAENMTHVRRAEAGYIPASKISACTIGGLTAKSARDVDLKNFLNQIAFIPEEEDTGDDYPWAEDKRDARQIDVRHGPAEPDTERDRPFPAAGERVC